MNNKPFISVVIPAFNEEKYIANCLQAIKKQTYPSDKYEVIVSDNNSTDKTVKIAKKFKVSIVNTKKQGNTFALAKGCSNAKGDIIACTDADSVVDSRWLEKIAETFTETEIVAITGRAEIDFNSSIAKFIVSNLYSIFLRLSFALNIPNLSGFNMAFRQKHYSKIGGINESIQMSPDVDLGRRFKDIGKVAYIPEIFVTTSARRWKSGLLKTLWEYAEGYISINFLHKPPRTKQKVIR